MATYSTYSGTDWHTIGSTLQLANPSTQSYEFSENKVVTDIPNNDQKLIVPTSIRNAVLSLYDSIAFKENIVGGKYFIGIDSTRQNLKMPIYLGKRLFRGSEVVNSSILSAHDITIHNTKPDNSGQLGKTSMVFLTGTFSNLPSTSPKVEANVVTTGNIRRVDLSLLNDAGDVSVLSKQSGANDPGGTVSLNSISYPSWQDSLVNAGEEKTLVYSNGSVHWSGLTPSDPGFYGSTGSSVPLFGKETFVNGYALSFTDTRWCPISIGDIELAETFEEDALAYVLERIIYDYLPPTCTLSLSDTAMQFPEIGSSPTVYLKYEVTKKTNDTKPTALTNMVPGQLAPIIGLSRTVSGTATGTLILPVEPGSTIFKITASDGTSFNSATVSVTGVYPYFYGFTASTEINNGLVRSLTKTVSGKSTQRIDVIEDSIKSTDLFYFMYDYDYGPLASIKDPSGSDIMTARFTTTDRYLSSPNGYWAQKRMRVYVSNGLASLYTTNAVSAFFTFSF